MRKTPQTPPPDFRRGEVPWELKLASGKIIEWDGVTGEGAALSYVDCIASVHGRVETVVATRPSRRHPIRVWGGERIIE
ncbi:MAG TPA: hypothetical protein DCQ64_12645 [Candidatus Rokubacteria bacterium]|nr:hypothetical protein [Candidatus Rokubacteria bacterium]